MYAQLPSGARGLIFGLSLHAIPYFTYARSKGSGKTAGCAGSSEPTLLAFGIRTKILSARLIIEVVNLKIGLSDSRQNVFLNS